jgi:hypothetical protein
MRDVYPGFVFQPPRCPASGVEGEILWAPAQEPDASPVSSANEAIEIQSERLAGGKDPATVTVVVLKLDAVRRATDDLAQLLTLKKHV